MYLDNMFMRAWPPSIGDHGCHHLVVHPVLGSYSEVWKGALLHHLNFGHPRVQQQPSGSSLEADISALFALIPPKWRPWLGLYPSLLPDRAHFLLWGGHLSGTPLIWSYRLVYTSATLLLRHKPFEGLRQSWGYVHTGNVLMKLTKVRM